MEIRIGNDEISELLNIEKVHFEKYVPQILNLANQNSQATRPRNVGQLSELFQEFIKSQKGASVSHWEEWYTERYPDAIEFASNKIYEHVKGLKRAIDTIDIDTVREWVRDLTINKTFSGLYFQEAIIRKIAEIEGKNWRLARDYEESKGIDGFIGDRAVSIKPITYKTMDRLRETIDVTMVYYEKVKSGVIVTTEE